MFNRRDGFVIGPNRRFQISGIKRVIEISANPIVRVRRIAAGSLTALPSVMRWRRATLSHRCAHRSREQTRRSALVASGPRRTMIPHGHPGTKRPRDEQEEEASELPAACYPGCSPSVSDVARAAHCNDAADNSPPRGSPGVTPCAGEDLLHYAQHSPFRLMPGGVVEVFPPRSPASLHRHPRSMRRRRGAVRSLLFPINLTNPRTLPAPPPSHRIQHPPQSILRLRRHPAVRGARGARQVRPGVRGIRRRTLF